MLNFSQLLNLLQFLNDLVRSKIMTYYLSYGTPVSHAIRALITQKITDPTTTLWRAIIDNNRLYMLNNYFGSNYDTMCELRLCIIEECPSNKYHKRTIDHFYKVFMKNKFNRMIEEEKISSTVYPPSPKTHILLSE